jgi:hypothetical protein
MGIKPLDDAEILIGQGTDKPDPKPQSITAFGKIFERNCPLWTYVLAEAMLKQTPVKIPVKENITVTTPQLGPVGGRIVAEVFLGLMFGDGNSLLSLDPTWQPKTGPAFALKDLVKYALGS